MTTMNEARVGFEAWLGITPKGAAHDLAYEAFKAGAAWQRAHQAERPGYMPIPTAEQVAEALANVRCFHDMSAELIAPELLKNLLAAAPATPAAQVAVPDGYAAPVGKHEHLYECASCGGMYLEKVSQCDCMPDVQQFNEWIAYPKQASAAHSAGVPVGWQFYQDGKWWNGDDKINNHRANTEAAGYPVRDVYAAPAQPAVQGEGVKDE